MILYRMNPRGSEYMLTALDKNTTHVSVNHKSIVIQHPLEKLNQSWYDWNHGAYIQVAFDYLNADEREFLMTGITKEEWDILFPPEPEN